MVKVAFFLDSHSMPNKDYSDIVSGNPGIAGSEYEILLVSYLLEQRGNNINSVLITNADVRFPHNRIVYASSLNECCHYCDKNKIELLVIDIKYFNKSVLDQYSKAISIIIWAHNDVSYKQWNLFSSLTYIKRIVNVGREEMELYRDHVLTEKSTFIYNIFPIKDSAYYRKKIKYDDNHCVAYMGSIVKMKGFHILARAWKKVIKEIPDAQLYVIGSGKLYDNSAILGKYGIASKKYEEMFMPYLVDEKGRILPSVHFLGLLSDDKYDVLGKCKVGVPNPTGFSETFCICALEMQLMGCNITTISHPAYYDSVLNKEYLFKNEEDLADYLIERLLSPRDKIDELYDFISNNFGIAGNIEKWEDLILNIESPNIVNEISTHNIQNKKLKDIIFKIKRKYGIGRSIPSINFFFFIIQKFREKKFDMLFKFKF